MNELYGRGAADTAPEPVRPEAPAEAGRSGTADLPAEPAPPDQTPEARESADGGEPREPQELLKQQELDKSGQLGEQREPGTPPEPREPEASHPSAAPDAPEEPEEPGAWTEATAATEPADEQSADTGPATDEPAAPAPWYATATSLFSRNLDGVESGPNGRLETLNLPTDASDGKVDCDGESRTEETTEGSIWGGIREAVSDWKAPADHPLDRHATVDRPDFNALEIPEEGVTLVHYGTPLDGPDGKRTPLFDGPPSREQTEQGNINDCGIVATMGAVAGHRPEIISQCIRENDDGTYEVTLHQTKHSFDGDWRHYEPTGAVTVLTITPDLPVKSLSPDHPAYANSGDSAAAWPMILEKAIAGLDQTWDESRLKRATGYVRLDQGSFPDDRAELLTQLTGEPAYTEDFPKQYDMRGRSPDKQLLDAFRERISNGCPVLVGTISVDDGRPPLTHKLVAGHAYEVSKVDDQGLIHLRNPHNINQPPPLRIEEFKKNFKNRYTTLE